MKLVPDPLTAEAFAPFGTVFETTGADHFEINEGWATRFHALAETDVGADGTAIISIFLGRRRPDPIRLTMMERHPLASQAFMPLVASDWLVVVGTAPLVGSLRCFRARGDQGVQYARGIWHHPLLVLASEQSFLIVDRDGPGNNLEEQDLDQAVDLEGY